MKNNTGISKAISFSVVLVGIAVFYYYVIFLPHRLSNGEVSQNTQDDFSKSMRCRELGEKYFNEQSANKVKDVLDISPKYTFNKKLNTCFYWGGILTGSGDGSTKEWSKSEWITDLATNNEIVSYYLLPNDRRKATLEDMRAWSDFNKKSKELFGE